MLSNYRPMTVLPFCSKLIEICIVNSLISYLTKIDLLISKKFGFCPTYSTEWALMTFTEVITRFIDKRYWSRTFLLILQRHVPRLIIVCLLVNSNHAEYVGPS